MGRDGIRKAVAVIGVAATLVSWIAVEVAATGTGGQEERAGPSSTRVTRATRFYGVGPSAEYDFDVGSIGEVRPLRLALEPGTTSDIVVTISMDYRTTGDDRFVVGPLVRRDGRFGPVVEVRPQVRAVAASSSRTSKTATFLLRDLRGGHEYWFSPTVNVSLRVGDRSSITSRHVVLVVDATPS